MKILFQKDLKEIDKRIARRRKARTTKKVLLLIGEFILAGLIGVILSWCFYGYTNQEVEIELPEVQMCFGA